MSSRGEHNFIVKAEYRGITRKFSFDHFPVWNELFQQLYKVFRIDHYYLSRLLLSAQDDTQRILIARESHSAQQYNVQVAPFLSTHNHWGLLRFSVCDEKARKAPISPPRRFTIPTVLEQMDVDDAPYRPLPVPPAPASWWTNATSVPTSAPSIVSSSSSSAKEEVKQLMDSFFIDLNNTLSKFGISQADVTGPPASADTDMRDTPSASNSAAPEIRIPGSFVDAPTPRATTPVSHPVHPDVWCDACNDPVRGIRHKCMVCWNFDLCDNCINKPGIQETHSNGAAHPFKAINPPGEDSSPVVDPAPHFGATHNVACDVCQELIVGSRYKCTQCLDYDMCRGCYTKYRGAHRLEHDFAVSHIPGASPKPASPIRLPVVPPNVPSTSSQPGSSAADWANWKPRSYSRIPTFQTFGPAAGSRTAPEAAAAAATPTPVRVPRDTTDLPVHGASCDSCSETIRGVRHKCLDCEDFDFCDECITTARHTHNEAHTFYAIAIPGTVIVHKVYDDVPAVAPLPAQPPPSQPAPGALSSGELARMRLRKSIANRHEAMHSRHHHGRGRSAPAADVPAPTTAPSPPVVHNASCDLCDSRITGDRYKCTRCPDYDVCSSCFTIVPEQHPHHAFARIEKPKDIMTSQSEQFTTVHPAVCDSCNKHIIGVRYKCLHADCPDVDFCQHCEALPIPVHPFNHPLVKFKYDFTTESPEIRSVFKYAQRKSKSAKSPTTETITETLVDVSCPPVSSNVTPTTPYASEISHSQNNFSCPPEVQVMIPRAESPKDINEDYFPGVPKDEPHSQSAPAPTTAEEPPQMEQRTSTPAVTLPTRSVLVTPPPPPAPVLPPAPAPAPVEEEKIDASFVEDNNIPDGHAFPAGAEFVKSWRLGNTGNVAWPEDTEIAFVSGDRVSGDSAPDAYAVGHVSPGEEVDVHALDMKAPEEAGTYTSTWRLRHGKTEYFGDLVWCQITVVEHEASDESNMSASSIIIPPSAPAEDNSIHPAQSVIAPSLTARSATMSAAVSVVSDSAGSPVSSISAFSDHSGMWSEVADQRDEAHTASATAPRHIEQPDYVLVYDSSDDDSD